MKKCDEKINCEITDMDGNVLFEGTTEDLKNASLATGKKIFGPMLSRLQPETPITERGSMKRK